MQIETWRHVWRNGIVPNATVEGLEALKTALEVDDPRLTQGCTTTPPPLLCVYDWPVECACATGFMGWQGGAVDGDGKPLEKVGQVVDYFAAMCQKCDEAVGGYGECRWFLNWFDDTPRDEMRRELLAEVELALAARTKKETLADIFSVPGHQVGAA